jgi:orotidine-5'-phosphate decarboxylase
MAVTPIPIVALDVPDEDRALSMVRQLGDSCAYYKVGSELFTACGPSIVETIRNQGKRIFLDLKFHDIPNTVRSAARSAASCGASLLTVHAIGGREMIEAAAEGAGSGCGVLAVTVLTSLDAPALSIAIGRSVASIPDEVSRLAIVAAEGGAHGVVCSGQEAARVRAEQGNRLAILVPGIRLKGDATHDQSRVVTPSDGARAGATYLVLGRTVTAAQDPVGAMRQVHAELGLNGSSQA